MIYHTFNIIFYSIKQMVFFAFKWNKMSTYCTPIHQQCGNPKDSKSCWSATYSRRFRWIHVPKTAFYGCSWYCHWHPRTTPGVPSRCGGPDHRYRIGNTGPPSCIGNNARTARRCWSSSSFVGTSQIFF